MSDSLDKAAMAFDTNMGVAPASPGSSGVDEVSVTETMFPNVGELEIDETSPARGGGDDMPIKGERRVKAKKVETDDEIDPEEALYADDPKDPDEDEDEDEDNVDDPDEDEGGDEKDPDDIDFDAEVEVTVDGKIKTVNLREAVDGYIRLETFHQRLNEVNEIQDVIQREATTLVADRRKYIELLDQQGATLAAMLPEEPDWDALFAKDAASARRTQRGYEAMKKQIGDIAAKRQTEVAALEADLGERTKKFAATERTKFENGNPNWVGTEGEKRKAKDISSMVRTARSVGFTDQEIVQTYDSRMLNILLKASKYDRMMASRPKPVIKGKKTVVPGKGSSRTVRRDTSRSSQRLAQTGRLEDAGHFFTDLIRK